MNFHGQIIVAEYTKSTIYKVAKKNSCMMRGKKKGKNFAKSMSCDFATLYDELSLNLFSRLNHDFATLYDEHPF